MKAKIYIFFLFVLACGNAYGNSHHLSPAATASAQDTLPVFTLPDIPPVITSPELRAEYLVEHYWDNMNFADNHYIHHPEITEQAWADYCNILNHVPLSTAQQSLRKTIGQANVNKKMFTYLTELADKYLYNPNSPMRNEEFYIPVLEAMLRSPLLNKTEKIRPQARLTLAQKNRAGTQALDFTYTLKSGTQGTLYQLNTEYILLFINNPGCHACSETIGQLQAATTINKLLREKRITILSVYPDEELDEWNRHLADFPSEWINAYDKRLIIRDKQLYDLKAIPTLYLLNRKKTVLLKDVTVLIMEEYLRLRQ